ncbi:MAG: hypothetical protein HRU25_12130 [Psychrobium sp.]|nr:hypothetical protein [Psychrobium sp.]
MIKMIVRLLAIALLFLGNIHIVNAQRLTLSAQKLTDNTGLKYIGYTVPNQSLTTYLAQMKDYLENDAKINHFQAFRAAQIKRDHASFHITLINPYEYPDVAKIDVSELPQLTFELLGVGQAQKQSSRSFFVVAKSSAAQKIRHRFNLADKDLHITLGFKPTDVFGVDKSELSLITAHKK